jgi:hypothetical protein
VLHAALDVFAVGLLMTKQTNYFEALSMKMRLTYSLSVAVILPGLLLGQQRPRRCMKHFREW